MDKKLIQRFMARFEGYNGAYGTYNKNAAGINPGGKVEIKSTAQTLKKDVTFQHWRDHLEGKESLGIIPINEEQKVRWGCIDIDEYGVDIGELYRRIDREHYSLIICASKSDGAHCFLLMDELVPASAMKMCLEEMAANIGYGGSEVFPKQSHVFWERMDFGNWLNMPYFGDTRWAYRRDGTKMPLKEFLDLADECAQPAEVVTKAVREDRAREGASAEFKDGPPCMEYLSIDGLGEGSRNEGLLAFGIFAKKKFNNWEDVLNRWNYEHCKPPLPPSEVADIIKRLKAKDYFYPCRKQPIQAHCRSALCRVRKHGVASGNGEDMPVLGGLSMLDVEEPLWFLDVNGIRIELTSDQFFNYRAFQKVCGMKLQLWFRGMKQDDWGLVIGAAMRETLIIKVSPEVSNHGQFKELVDEFLNSKQKADNRNQILMSRPWLDDQCTVELPPAVMAELNPAQRVMKPRHFFRLKDLQGFLNAANFTIYSRPQLTMRLKMLNGGAHFFKLKDEKIPNSKEKGTNVWFVPEDEFDPTAIEMETPPLQENPI